MNDLYNWGSERAASPMQTLDEAIYGFNNFNIKITKDLMSPFFTCILTISACIEGKLIEKNDIQI